MQIVIEIPENFYKGVKVVIEESEDITEEVVTLPMECIANGTPLPKGKWEVKGQDIYCSICGEQSAYNVWGASMFSNFCPYCGADMRGDENEDSD